MINLITLAFKLENCFAYWVHNVFNLRAKLRFSNRKSFYFLRHKRRRRGHSTCSVLLLIPLPRTLPSGYGRLNNLLGHTTRGLAPAALRFFDLFMKYRKER